MASAQMMYASYGFNHAVEGFTHIKDMNTLKRAAKENRLFIDIASLPGFNEMDVWLNNPEYKFGEYNNRLKFQGGKFRGELSRCHHHQAIEYFEEYRSDLLCVRW